MLIEALSIAEHHNLFASVCLFELIRSYALVIESVISALIDRYLQRNIEYGHFLAELVALNLEIFIIEAVRQQVWHPDKWLIATLSLCDVVELIKVFTSASMSLNLPHFSSTVL